MNHNTENNPSEQNKPESGWVWHCNDASIAAGQVSVLAIVEVILAVCVYWWLAFYFEWPWMALISMIAAPMLLLRSKESIALGVKLLSLYWVPGYKKNISHREKMLTLLPISLMIALASYWQVISWSTSDIGWSLFWNSIVLIVSTFAIIFVITIVAVGPGALMGAISNSIIFKTSFNHFFFPLLVMGVLIRVIAIRLYATLSYPLAGLTQLPQNWRETLLVVDCFHPPELLPQASTINPKFSAKGSWEMQKKWTVANKLLGLIPLFAWYFPALIYRWSLKASAWLWFPLSLAFSPPLHQKRAQNSRRLMAILHTWHWYYLAVAVVAMLWLFSPTSKLGTWILLAGSDEHHKIINGILSVLPEPPAFGLFHIQLLACLACFLTVWMIIQSKNLKASHGKLYDSPAEFDKLAPENKDEFQSLAKPIDKLRLCLIAVVVLWGEMMVLGIAHTHYPDFVERFIHPAILPYF